MRSSGRDFVTCFEHRWLLSIVTGCVMGNRTVSAPIRARSRPRSSTDVRSAIESSPVVCYNRPHRARRRPRRVPPLRRESRDRPGFLPPDRSLVHAQALLAGRLDRPAADRAASIRRGAGPEPRLRHRPREHGSSASAPARISTASPTAAGSSGPRFRTTSPPTARSPSSTIMTTRPVPGHPRRGE